MSFKRRVLSALGKDALLEVGRGLEFNAHGIPPDQDPISFLLELNQLVADDGEQGRKARSLPDHLDRRDSRWFSTDCIEPSKAES